MPDAPTPPNGIVTIKTWTLDWLTAPPPNERLEMNLSIALWSWLKMKPASGLGRSLIVAIASLKLT
jgi:hypothetical protein